MRTPAVRKNIEDIFPLSPAQQGMLYHALKSPGTGVYVEQISARLPADLDPDRFRDSWERTISRHGALRTFFVSSKGGQPLQIVRRRVDAPWSVEDWSLLDSEEANTRIEDRLRQDRKLGLALEQAPLLRFLLIDWPGDGWVFVWTFHHLILDGWSTARVLAEVRTLYSRGEPPALPSEPFSAYVGWLSKQDQVAAEGYWRGLFEDFEAGASLSTVWQDVEPPAESGGYQNHETVLDSPRTAALEDFARSRRVTLNTVFQAAWALLLSRYSGEDDVVFGVAVAGRPADFTGADAMVGMFINTLPARVRLEDQRPVDDWLRSIQIAQTEARQFQYSALSDVQGWAGVTPDSPLFETLLVFENYPVWESPESGALTFESVVYREQSNYPLSLLVVPGSPWRLILVFDSSRVSERTAITWMESFQQILTDLTDGQCDTVAGISACSATQRATLLEWGTGPTLECNPGSTVIEALRSRIRQRPEAIALEGAGSRSSYAELNERLAGLAGGLSLAGVSSGDIVPVLGRRDSETIACMLAVHAAGAAYLPLDADYPESRLAEILLALEAAVPLPRRVAITTCPVPEALNVAMIDWRSREALEAAPGGGAGKDPVPADLAYLIFTSGSTGGPKGVPVRHRNLAWSTWARFDYYPSPPGRFLLLSPLAFDSSVAGLFWTLCAGGTLLLPDETQAANPAYLADLLVRGRVTHLLCLPSLWAVLLDALPPDARTDLVQVIVAGETCPPSLPRAHARRLPHARLDNEYGPTEGTVWCTAQRLDQFEWTSPVPIGGAVPGVELRVCDGRDRLVPPGAVGELHLSGPGVVDGYLNAPDQSAAGFTQHGGRGKHVYRTGDRVRWLADGSLAFMGRLDDQLKVRGHRVEPAEVEAVISAHPAVGACGVLPSPSAGLAALVEPSDDADLDPAKLREWLRKRVPAHQLPDQITLVKALPRLPSGKLDRKALPAALGASDPGVPPWVPADGIDAGLVALWREMLGRPPEREDTSFLDAGGHSLLSMRMLVELERRFGKRLSLADFLDAPTVAGLKKQIRQGGRVSQWQSMVPVRPSGSSAPFFCVHGDPTALAPHLDAETPYYWLHHAQAGGNVSYSTVESLARDHLVEIRGVQPTGPYRLGGFSFGGLLAYEIARQLQDAGETVEFLGLIEPTLPGRGRSFVAPSSGPDSGKPVVRRTPGRWVRRQSSRVRRGLRSARCKWYVRTGRTMPDELRNFHMVELFSSAGMAYSYPRYDGDAVLFLSARSAANPASVDAVLGHWKSMCRKGAELLVVQGVPKHSDLFREPFVNALAESINRYLS